MNLRARQPAPIRQGDPLHWRISVYILFRLVLASIFLILVAAQVIGGDQLSVGTNSYFYLEIATFLLMGISALGLRTVRSLQSLAYLQFIVDTVLITVLVTQTGGIRSLFTVLYFMTIVASAYLVYRRGSLIVAALNSAAFVVVAIVQPMTHLEPNQVLTSTSPSVSPLYAEVLTGVFGFFLVAILAGQLADKLRETGQALIEQEAQSRALQEALTQIANTIRGGLVIIGADQRLRSANPTALKLFPTLQDAPASESIPRFDSEQAVWEVQLQEEDQIRHVILSRSPLEDGGVVITMEDVTRLRGMERVMQREERQAAVGRLAAGIAHEIRNPLASLSGAIQLLKDEHEGPLLDIAQREVLRLNDLVGEFLASARPISLRLTLVSVSAIVDEVVAAFGKDPRYGEQVDIVVAEEDDGDGDGQAVLDADRVHQVLWNLLLNAAQAMPEGGTIHVSLRLTQRLVTIEVRDEGIGISQEELAKVFDPFYTTRQGGTGLGLANVDRLVRAHGGTVGVRSRVGDGTTFILDFPRKHQHDETTPAQDED